MKYMTFNSSCSYAGVANMLSCYGVDVEDREIALGMELPYLFAKEEGAYKAGPMLQSGKWFALFLNPLGFEMEETEMAAEEAAEFLRGQRTAMLGILVGEGDKHAVTYIGEKAGKLRLRNNKWEKDSAPEELVLTEEELMERLEKRITVATLKEILPREVDTARKIVDSMAALRENYEEICRVCAQEHTVAELRGRLNTLFRPLLLDGITMLTLLEERELAEEFSAVQRDFLAALQQEGTARIRLGDFLPMERFAYAVDGYVGRMECTLRKKKGIGNAGEVW